MTIELWIARIPSIIMLTMVTAMTCWMVWKGEHSERKWWWWIAAAIPLTLVSAIRWDVGTDFYLTYFPAFRAMECQNAGGGADIVNSLMGPLFERLQGGTVDTVDKLYWNFVGVFYNQEWGFQQLMRFCSWSGLGFRGVVVICSLLIGGCVFTAIYRQSKMPWLAAYLYVTTSNYFLGLNIMRQFVAIGFMLVGVEFIVRRKMLPFIACIAVGMLFHYTVALLLPCYFVCRWKVKPHWCLALIGLALIGSTIAEPVALWTLPKIGLGHYCRYFGENSPWAQDGFEHMLFFINLAFVFFGGVYWNRIKNRSEYFIVWYNLTVIGTMMLALSGAIPLMKRVNYYFAAPQFLLLPEILACEDDVRRRKLLTWLVVLAFFAETFVAVFMTNKNEPLPYRCTCHPQHIAPR